MPGVHSVVLQNSASYWCTCFVLQARGFVLLEAGVVGIEDRRFGHPSRQIRESAPSDVSAEASRAAVKSDLVL